MSLTDKEIALELTKAYLDHLNARVNNQATKSHSTVENTSKTYQYFYNAVSNCGADK